MDESVLQNRLDAIERKQSLTVSLLVVAYLFVAIWLLVEATEVVTVWNAGVGVVGLAIVASMVGMYRRRRARA